MDHLAILLCLVAAIALQFFSEWLLNLRGSAWIIALTVVFAVAPFGRSDPGGGQVTFISKGTFPHVR
jgi:hypothetical protein